MKVVLVNPRRKTYLFSDDTENLGLGYLAAMLRRNGFLVVLIDAELEGISNAELVSRVVRELPDLVGISMLFQLTAKPALGLADSLRQAGVTCHITAGGHFPTFAFREILTGYAGLDSVVRGEGELALLDLANALRSGAEWRSTPGLAYREGPEVVANPCRPLVENLDVLPNPARDTLPIVLRNGGAPCIATSRGCYGGCSFCSIQSFYGLSHGQRWRPRSPGAVVDEFERIVKDFGARDFWVVDDTFIGPSNVGRERAYALGELLIQRSLRVNLRISSRADEVDKDLFMLLKRAGVVEVFLGVEAGTNHSLRVFNKGTTPEQNESAVRTLREVGLKVNIGFILLHPYSTLDDLTENLAFLRKIGVPVSQLPVSPTDFLPRLQVLVGTPIAKRLSSDGLLKGDYLDYSYEFRDPLISKIYALGAVLRKTVLPVQQIYRRIRRRGLDGLRILKV